MVLLVFFFEGTGGGDPLLNIKILKCYKYYIGLTILLETRITLAAKNRQGKYQNH